nr:hypothetical protein CFP56_11038 [Quercus suber]
METRAGRKRRCVSEEVVHVCGSHAGGGRLYCSSEPGDPSCLTLNIPKQDLDQVMDLRVTPAERGARRSLESLRLSERLSLPSTLSYWSASRGVDPETRTALGERIPMVQHSQFASQRNRDLLHICDRERRGGGGGCRAGLCLSGLLVHVSGEPYANLHDSSSRPTDDDHDAGVAITRQALLRRHSTKPTFDHVCDFKVRPWSSLRRQTTAVTPEHIDELKRRDDPLARHLDWHQPQE